MNILNAQVEWNRGLTNNPRLVVLAEGIPDHDALLFRKRDGLYFGELNGYVKFYCWSGGQQEGFGGDHRKISLIDGSEVTLMGPWSSRAGVMNGAGFQTCIDVALTGDHEVWRKGRGFSWGAITLAMGKKAAIMAGVHLARVDDDPEEIWAPSTHPNRVEKPAHVSGI